MIRKFSLILLLAVLTAFGANAQCDTIVQSCEKHMSAKFVSDGQSYRALLLDTEIAEFQSTFYGETVYRISVCSSLPEGNIVFRILDEKRNVLFSNADQKNAPYWDFKFLSTLDCFIEAQLTPGKSKSGCAVMLISFKQ
jgi:hypothetical protein